MLKKEDLYYVTMTDRFLSGWGVAEGKKSKVIITCQGYKEAVKVIEYANKRTDMVEVRMVANKPKYNPQKYHVEWANREDYKRFYKGV